MYKGISIKGIDFYNLLAHSKDFTSELGKVTLASGKLEAEVIMLLTRCEIKGNYNKATLGTLIGILNENKLLTENENIVYDMISKQRN